MWYCKFSPDGLKLATGSKDQTVHIYDVDPQKLSLKSRRSLEGQNFGVSFIAWAPDSKHLIVCGPEDSPDLFIWNIDEEKIVCKMSNSPDDSLTSAAFNKDGKKFVTGGQKGQFYVCDMSGTIHDSWDGVRVNALAFRSDNKSVLAADTLYRIRDYSFETRTEQNL